MKKHKKKYNNLKINPKDKKPEEYHSKTKKRRKNKDKLKKKKQEKTQLKKDIKKIEKQLAEFEYYNTKIS